MANLTETATYEAGIYRIETTDLVLGGEDGISNIAAKQLANRTAYLKQVQDSLVDGTGFNDHVITPEALSLSALKSHIRQTILSGRVNTQGFANFLVTNSFSDQVRVIATEEEPLVLSCAAGYNVYGAADYHIGRTTNLDITISGVPADASTVYIYRTVNPTYGTVTSAATNIRPIYREVAPSHVDGLMWFNTRKQRWYESDGAAWTAINPRVFIGYATRNSGGEVLTAQAYHLRYDRESVPVGTIEAYTGTKPPFGWLFCRGDVVSRTRYDELFDLIGTMFDDTQTGDNFKLPDLRGEFIRGLDNTGVIDSGRTLGDKQEGAMPGHSHFLTNVEVESGTGTMVAGAHDASDDIATSFVGTSGLSGGQIRPRNMALNYIIKF
jgi:microcystin-dependent protein